MLNFVIPARVTLLKYFLNLLVLRSLERIAPLKWLTYELAVNQIQLTVLQINSFVVVLDKRACVMAPKLGALHTRVEL